MIPLHNGVKYEDKVEPVTSLGTKLSHGQNKESVE